MVAIRTNDRGPIDGFDSVGRMDNNTRFTQLRALDLDAECNCPEPCNCDHENE